MNRKVIHWQRRKISPPKSELFKVKYQAKLISFSEIMKLNPREIRMKIAKFILNVYRKAINTPYTRLGSAAVPLEIIEDMDS